MWIKAYWSNYSVYWDYFYLNDLLNSDLPIMTSLDCQTQYNLIPISSVDQAYCINNFPVIAITWVNQDYCVSNDLCPMNSNWVSNLFINDIFHPWAFNIIINIPEEIGWDYAYTSSWYNFNLDIDRYNVDYTKVQDQIDIQNYKPNSDDLSQIVSEIIPLFVPWLVIILLLYFIFRFIKKIF